MANAAENDFVSWFSPRSFITILQRVFHSSSPLLFFLLFCERIFRLINGGMEKEGRKKKEGEKMNGMFNY